MAGSDIRTIVPSMDAINVPIVVFERAIHLYWTMNEIWAQPCVYKLFRRDDQGFLAPEFHTKLTLEMLLRCVGFTFRTRKSAQTLTLQNCGVLCNDDRGNGW